MGKVNRVKEIRSRGKDGLKIDRQQQVNRSEFRLIRVNLIYKEINLLLKKINPLVMKRNLLLMKRNPFVMKRNLLLTKRNPLLMKKKSFL